MQRERLTAQSGLPEDWHEATLVGRAWVPGAAPGPSPVRIRPEGVYDLSAEVATLAELLAPPDPLARIAGIAGVRIGDVDAIFENSAHNARDPALPWLLAPADLQAIRACGVTFVRSMLERVIEEQAHGDPAAAVTIRTAIAEEIGASLQDITPGSPDAARTKAALQARGLWSQYLEVGIGPDAEIFTKAQILASVGTGAEIGIRPDSHWNNPEPELVLAINRAGSIVGVSLGNDVNLRDFEGRSALLLGLAKDNRASCAIGPLIRLFDAGFSLDDARRLEVSLSVEGDDDFRLEGTSSLAEISRDITDLAAQAVGPHNQYPDGLLLFTGTMFAPIEDRDEMGGGFTHHLDDIVTIASPRLGALVNQVNYTHAIAPREFGLAELMHNLARRGLLGG